MPTPPKIAIVGQGPNRTAWEHGLEVGRRGIVSASRPGPEAYAELYCARVAITGSVGEKLAKIAGLHRLDFYRRFGRYHLNPRWNGKNGTGDAFDRVVAEKRVAEILALGSTSFVLLGAEVARAFGFKKFEPLNVVESYDEKRVRRSYLLFPHPSGINLWWNEPFNRHRAEKRLREFLELPQDENPKV